MSPLSERRSRIIGSKVSSGAVGGGGVGERRARDTDVRVALLYWENKRTVEAVSLVADATWSRIREPFHRSCALSDWLLGARVVPLQTPRNGWGVARGFRRVESSRLARERSRCACSLPITWASSPSGCFVAVGAGGRRPACPARCFALGRREALAPDARGDDFTEEPVGSGLFCPWGVSCSDAGSRRCKVSRWAV